MAFAVAVVAVIANAIALAVNFDSDKGPATTFTILACVLLAAMAWGMWRARYWAVLGMQTLLGMTVLLAAIGLVTAVNVSAALLLGVIIAGRRHAVLVPGQGDGTDPDARAAGRATRR